MNQEQSKSLAEVYKKLNAIQPQLDKALETFPEFFCSDRFITLFFHELKKMYQQFYEKKAKVLVLSTDSIVRCILTCVQYGLEPGVSGMVYLVPYGKDLTVMVGYKGMIELSYRSDRISSVQASCVYKNDIFSIKKGLNPDIIHEPSVTGIKKPEDFIGAYAVVVMKDGVKQFDFMNSDEIHNIRTTKSKTGNYGPWISDFDQMAQKTVIRRLLKIVPSSVAMQSMMANDETMEREGKTMHTIIEGMCEPEVTEEETKPQSDSLMEKLKEK